MDNKSRAENKGFSLIEILVALAITGIIISSVYALYITMTKSQRVSKLDSELQQSVRSTQDMITRWLNMAGYKQDCSVLDPLHRHGIIYQKGATVVTNDHSVCFVFSDIDPTYADLAHGYPKFDPGEAFHFNLDRRITVFIDNHEVKATMESYNKDSDIYTQKPGRPIVLAKDIDDLSFKYYDSTGVAFTPASQDDADKVRKITVSVNGKVSALDTLLGRSGDFSLTSEVKPRNLGIEGQSGDTTAPAVPTKLYVEDIHECGKLKATWVAPPDVDLAGYTLYIGTTTDCDDIAPKSLSSTDTTYTFTGLTNGVKHYVKIEARDKSGNVGQSSAVVSTGVTTTGVGVNDTTPDPDAPVGAVTLTATPDLGKVTLTWTKHNDADVVGYRVYRKKFDGSGFTVGMVSNDLISAPTSISSVLYYSLFPDSDFSDPAKVTVSGNTYTYVDTYRLIGCVQYDYLVMPINCDLTLIGSYDTSQFARVSDETTKPKDETKPASPPALVAVAGPDKVYLTWINPHDDDLTHVYIRRTTSGGCPQTKAEGIDVFAWNGLDPANFVAKDQSVAIEDRGLDSSGSTTYFYTVFCEDNCGNLSYRFSKKSTGDAEGTATVPCGDSNPISNEFGPPPAPPTNSYAMAYCFNADSPSVTLHWADPTSNTSKLGGNPAPDDITGYNVYRAAPDTYNKIASHVKGLNPYNEYSDTQLLTDGSIYKYLIRTVDCAEKESPDKDAYNNDNLVALTAYPGRVAYDTDSSKPTTTFNTYHNGIKFFTKNTSAHEALIKGMTITWSGKSTETNAILTQVSYLNGAVWVNLMGNATIKTGVTSGTYIGFPDNTKLPAATNTLLPTSVPFKLLWRTTTGAVNRTVDMRDVTVTIQYDYKLYYYNSFILQYVESNPEASWSGCTVTTYTLKKPAGPTIINVTQTKPYPTLALTGPGLLIVPGDKTTDVSANITDTSDGGVGMEYVKLFYSFSDRTSIIPPDTGGLPDDVIRFSVDHPRGFTAITTFPITQPALPPSYSLYKTTVENPTTHVIYGHPIPALNNGRVWYFLLALDKNGNFSRSPRPTGPDELYTYDELQGLAGGGGSVTPSFTSPAVGGTVSGVQTIKVSIAKDPSSATIQQVRVMIDSGAYQDAEYNSGTSTYDLPWDTMSVADGMHSISIDVLGLNGATLLHGSTSTSVTVNNPTAVTVSSISVNPLSGTATVTVNASVTGGGPGVTVDNVYVKVKDLSDTWVLCTKTGSVWTYTFDTAPLVNGPHTIDAYASSNTGPTNSDIQSVTVTTSNTVRISTLQIESIVKQGTAVGTPFSLGDVVVITVDAAVSGAAITSPPTIIIDGGLPEPTSLDMGSGKWVFVWDTGTTGTGPHTVRASLTVTGANNSPLTTAASSVTVNGPAAGLTINTWSPVTGSTNTAWLWITVNNPALVFETMHITITGPNGYSLEGDAVRMGGNYSYTWDLSSPSNSKYPLNSLTAYNIQADAMHFDPSVPQYYSRASGTATITLQRDVNTPTIVSPCNLDTVGPDILVQVAPGNTGPKTEYVDLQVVNNGAPIVDADWVACDPAGANFTKLWQASLLPGGQYDIYARARTANTTSAPVMVTANHIPPGSITVNYEAPVYGGSASGPNYTVRVHATSASPINAFWVRVDAGGWIFVSALPTTGTNLDGRWEYTLNTTNYANGPHSLAVALSDGTWTETVEPFVIDNPVTVNCEISNPWADMLPSDFPIGWNYWVSGNASATLGATNYPVDYVAISIDGVSKGNAVYDPVGMWWWYQWDTTAVLNNTNPHHITAVAHYGVATPKTVTRTVYVDNPITVSIMTPDSVTDVTSNADSQVSVMVSSSKSINSVTLDILNNQTGVHTPVSCTYDSGTMRWVYPWVVTSLFNGNYTFVATAYSGAESKPSDAVEVNLNKPVSANLSFAALVDGNGAPVALNNVNGTVTIKLSASSTGAGITSVPQLSLDGGVTWVNTTLNNVSGYYEYAGWNTQTVTNNPAFILRARLTVGSGANTNTSTPTESLNINNPILPTSVVTSPLTGTTITGTQTVSVHATVALNGTAISAVEISFDNGATYVACAKASGTFFDGIWTRTWATTNADNGDKILVARVTSGVNRVVSAPVNVTVDNTVVTAGIITPAAGTTVSTSLPGTPLIQVSVATNGGNPIDKVQVSTDNGVTWIDIFAAGLNGNGFYQYDWNTAGIVTIVSRTVKARAYAGTVAHPSAVVSNEAANTVTVDNVTEHVKPTISVVSVSYNDTASHVTTIGNPSLNTLATAIAATKNKDISWTISADDASGIASVTREDNQTTPTTGTLTYSSVTKQAVYTVKLPNPSVGNANCVYSFTATDNAGNTQTIGPFYFVAQ